MEVNERLRAIGDAKDEVLGAHVEWDSRRQAYRKTLHEVRTLAGDDAAAELAEWIEDTLRERERLPKGRRVRQKGADVCRDRGHSISTNAWLGA